MKTNPWFSTDLEEEDDDRPMHHDNTSCKQGDQIEKNHRRYGTDNRPLCPRCARLDDAGK